MDLLEGHHSTVLGCTGTGKTYFALRNLEKTRHPVIFFNPQKIPTEFEKVDKSYDIDHLIRYLKKGGKLDYIPSPFRKYAKMEINYIIQYLFAEDCFRNKNLYIAIDEAHDVARQGANNEYINMIPCRGRTLGLFGVFLAQRPALLDKTIITQSTKQFIFHTEPADDAYFKTKGVKADEVFQMLGDKPKDKHNYVIFENRRLSGPFKED